jgi:FkbM family methyltransferase
MPDFRSTLRRSLERHGWFLRRTAGLPLGVSFEHDWRHYFALPPPRLIVDVGAHRGESVARFSAAFPEAAIFAFEPVAENFRVLRETCGSRQHVTCLPLAASDRMGELEINLQSDSQTHSLETRPASDPTSSARRETIRLTTLDAVASERAWPNLDLLKIDTEGHELAVLRGARALFGRSEVRAIFVEATLDEHDGTHTLLGNLGSFLAAHRFRLAGIYDQSDSGRRGALAYFNALFLSDALPPRTS